MNRSNEASKGALTFRLRISVSLSIPLCHLARRSLSKRLQALSGDTFFAAMWLWGIDLL